MTNDTKNNFGFGKKDTNKTAAPWVGRKSVDGGPSIHTSRLKEMADAGGAKGPASLGANA
jgi:hypothetical protein